MSTSSTLWERDEQTEGKHLILKHYLDGWFPILGRWNGRLLFIDGFAGPGEYEDGGPGSPQVALDCIRRHKRGNGLQGVELVCIFIEADERRARHLEQLLAQQPQIPDTTAHVLQGTFDDHVNAILDRIDQQNEQLAPSFVVIDPFGAKGSPISLVERILGNPKSECMISFMYEPIRRFHRQPELERHLDELFGTKEWQRCLAMEESDAKKRFLHDLFARQLKEHGASHVIPFEMWKGNRHVYTIYFASGSPKGCNLMKQVIWKVEPSGSYAFRGHAGQARVLFDANTDPLAKQLKSEFGNIPTPIEDIEKFVMSDRTIYHLGHLRQKTLQPLERARNISVVRPLGGRGFPSNRGIKIAFH